MSYFIVFLGAGLGGLLRFFMGPLLQRSLGWDFPIGTVCVNMIGCLLIGFLAYLADSRGLFSHELRLFMFVGILGGFTTFSSFSLETIQLLKSGQILLATLNAVLSVVLGLLCVWIGGLLAKALFS